MWEHNFLQPEAEGARMDKKSTLAVFLLVCHNVFEFALSKLEISTGHLGSVGSNGDKFVDVKLWHLDVFVEQDAMGLPEQCSWLFCLWANSEFGPWNLVFRAVFGLLSSKTRSAVLIRL